MSLKSTKKHALIDFLSVLLEIATIACSKDNTKHGFIEAEIIDNEYKILATCCQQPTLEEYCSVIASFEDSLDIMDEKGHIKEEHYSVYGIRKDKDVNGQNVFRTAGIAQESFQRSKCLTHSHQGKMHVWNICKLSSQRRIRRRKQQI